MNRSESPRSDTGGGSEVSCPPKPAPYDWSWLEEAQRQEETELEERMLSTLTVALAVRDVLRPHDETLQRRCRQLVVVDAYGIKNRRAWDREADHIYRNLILGRIETHGLSQEELREIALESIDAAADYENLDETS